MFGIYGTGFVIARYQAVFSISRNTFRWKLYNLYYKKQLGSCFSYITMHFNPVQVTGEFDDCDLF